MLRGFALVVFVCLNSPSFGQGHPEWEIAGGYSFLSVDAKGAPRVSANGWQASFVQNLRERWAGEFEISKYYATTFLPIIGVPVTTSGQLYIGGPRINFRPAFVHVLLGAAQISPHTGFALAPGGGFEWELARHFALLPATVRCPRSSRIFVAETARPIAVHHCLMA